jgi:hypothetical protein
MRFQSHGSTKLGAHHPAAGAVQLQDCLHDLDHDHDPFLDRGGHADGHLRGGVAVPCTDAAPAIEFPVAAALVPHEFVDHPSRDAGVLQPGREGVAQVVGTVQTRSARSWLAAATALW